MPPADISHELEAAVLLASIVLGLMAVSTLLWRQFRKPYFLWWAAAWGLYALRIGAIITFLETGRWTWLYLHQVLTGWVGVTLLVAALAFAHSRRLAPRWIATAALVPPVWAWFAIFVLQSFTVAASLTVTLLAGVTAWTGFAFLRHHRRTGSEAARFMAWTFLLWGLHHLDYPLLRARGLLTPWSYYLDIAFILATGAGMLLLVMEDLRRGLHTLSALSGELQRGATPDGAWSTLLSRPLALPGVRGSAYYAADSRRFLQGAGSASAWRGRAPQGALARALEEAVRVGTPVFTRHVPGPADEASLPFAAVIPVIRGASVSGALVITGDAGDPFAALDAGFLVALGRQVGAALENEDLYQRLAVRTLDLERLGQRMLRQHEDERRRLSRELHDETAQVFSAVKLQLGLLRETAATPAAERLAQVTALVDEGMRSIRRVTDDLRPSLLDDLGLVPALRALARDVAGRTGLAVSFSAPGAELILGEEAELALFRGLQEALANATRHAGAHAVTARLARRTDTAVLEVEDDGAGLPDDFDAERLVRDGHLGLAGMQERVAALGGAVMLDRGASGGLRVQISVPLETTEAG